MLRVEAGTDAFVPFVPFVPGAADTAGNIHWKNGPSFDGPVFMVENTIREPIRQSPLLSR